MEVSSGLSHEVSSLAPCHTTKFLSGSLSSSPHVSVLDSDLPLLSGDAGDLCPSRWTEFKELEQSRSATSGAPVRAFADLVNGEPNLGKQCKIETRRMLSGI